MVRNCTLVITSGRCFVGVPHGCANAIFLRYNSKVSTRFPELARIIGKQTIEELAQAIKDLRLDVNNIGSIKEFGVSQEDWNEKLDYMATNALADPCTGFNPRKPNIVELKAIYQACYNGEIVNF